MNQEELLQRAKAAKSPGELLELAKSCGLDEFTEENAKAYFDALNKNGELTDSELENAAGGGCAVRSHGQKMVSALNGCGHFRCDGCNGGRTTTKTNSYPPKSVYLDETQLHDCSPKTYDPDGKYSHLRLCFCCYYYSYERGAWWCNNKLHYNE